MMKFLRVFIALLFATSVFAQSSTNSYKYIVTATTTTVTAQGSTLVSITINGGTVGAVSLFDIGSAGCTGAPASGAFGVIVALAANTARTLTYNLRVKNGICVVTAQATDVTVTYNF
jgi:hypothetical protein